MAIIEAIGSRIDLLIVGILILVALVVLVVDLVYLAVTEPKKRRKLKELRAGRKSLGDSPVLSE
jgi:hypothetical protein